MKTYLECLPCLLRQAVEAAQMATEDERVQQTVAQAVLRDLQDVPAEARPVDIAPRVHAAVREITGCEDPYREVKSRSNALALRAYSEAAELTSASPDPLLTAAKLAAAANIADSAVGRDFDFMAAMERALSGGFAIAHYPQLRTQLEHASHVLYLADNAGEIVFDRLLLERLAPRHVTLAVKSSPLLNDATFDDAQAARLDGLASVVTTGDGWPRPDLTGASRDFRAAFRQADVIIAKGQGNYEALSECNASIFFLLVAKCPVIARHLGVTIGDLVLKSAGPL
jgi:uncharacterized protein with ATP-grasp and redox domains